MYFLIQYFRWLSTMTPFCYIPLFSMSLSIKHTFSLYRRILLSSEKNCLSLNFGTCRRLFAIVLWYWQYLTSYVMMLVYYIFRFGWLKRQKWSSVNAKAIETRDNKQATYGKKTTLQISEKGCSRNVILCFACKIEVRVAWR